MKKFCSVMLAVIVLISVFPLSVFAATVVLDDTVLSGINYTLSGAKNYVINAGTTVTVPGGKKLKAYGSSTLQIDGQLVISAGANCDMDGSVGVQLNGNMNIYGNAKLACDFQTGTDAALTVESSGTVDLTVDSFNASGELLFYGGGGFVINGTVNWPSDVSFFILRDGSSLTYGKSGTVGENTTLDIREGCALKVNADVTVKGTLKSVGNIYVLAGKTLTIDENSLNNKVSGTLTGGGTLSVAGNVTVPSYETLYLDDSVCLAVVNKLTADGNVISRGGKLLLKYNSDGTTGKLVNPDNVGGNSSATKQYYFAEVYFPGFVPPTITDKSQVLQVSYGYSTTGLSSDDIHLENWISLNPYTPATLMIPLNQYLYFKMVYVDVPTGLTSMVYDASRMEVKYNNYVMNVRSDKHVVEVTSAGKLEINVNAYQKNNANLDVTLRDYEPFKQYRVYLSQGTGYKVYTRQGNVSDNVSTLWYSYGKEVAFNVNIADDYSDCASQVKVFLVQGYGWNEDIFATDGGVEAYSGATEFVYYDTSTNSTVPSVPYYDQYGYYHFTMLPERQEEGSNINPGYSVYVTGVVANDTISLVSSIVEMLKNILESIKQFFAAIKTAFGIG